MTSIRCLGFLLFLLCCRVYGESPEPMFRTKGSNVEMGYCFGVDYILVYRSTVEGDQLLGNSSESITPVTPPADLEGRINMNHQEFLLGLQILNLTQMDSAVYRKECWQNGTQVSQLAQELLVCNEETEPLEIIVKEEETWTELRCNSTSAQLEGTSVRWYHEMYPSYKLTLFLDSNVSLEPLREELQSLVEVKDKGALLMLDNGLLKNNQQFYCVVVKGKDCLSSQNMYLPDCSVARDMFASEGERMVLHCPSDGHNQHWETPLGRMNGSSMMQSQMHIKTKDQDFSLVITSVTDELSGEYSCISSLCETQYFLFLCPETVLMPGQKVSEGVDIILNCGDEDTDQRVLWYRKQMRKEHMEDLIYDSKDYSVPIPEELKGKITSPNNGHSLKISNFGVADEGTYSCVKFGGLDNYFADIFNVDEDDEDDEGDEDDEDDEDAEDALAYEDYPDKPSWNESQKCIFKQETHLTVHRVRIIEILPTEDPSPQNSFTYSIIGSVVGVLVLVTAAIGLFFFIRKKRPKKAANQTTNNGTEEQRNQEPLL